MINCTLNGKDITIHLKVGLIKKSILRTKNDLKNVTNVDISSFALKTNLANLKPKADELYTDKLVSLPVDLSKLSNAVEDDVV